MKNIVPPVFLTMKFFSTTALCILCVKNADRKFSLLLLEFLIVFQLVS